MNRLLMARAVLIAIALAVIALFYVPLGHTDFFDRWREGTFGFRIAAFSEEVTAVEDQRLLHAGVEPGDRVDLNLSTAQSGQVRFPHAGDRRTFTFFTARGPVTRTLVASAQPFSAIDRFGGFLAIIPATVFFIVAFTLVWLRPGPMTWSFLLYAVGFYSTLPMMGFYSWAVPRAYIAWMFLGSTLLGNFAALPLVPFVLRFPEDDDSPWRMKLERFVWAALAVAFAAYTYRFFLVEQNRPVAPFFHTFLDNYLPLAAFLAAAIILIYKYKHAEGDERQRMSWLVGGMLASFVAYAVYFIPTVPPAIGQVVQYFAVLLPITVAYAVFKRRVLDINFALNRAVVYGILSIILLAIVGLMDWLSGRLVGAYRFTTALEAAITIALGFLLSRVHQKFEDTVERLLFRARHQAEQYLRRVAQSLSYATEDQTIDDALVSEPVKALNLSAAALYRRNGDGRYTFVTADRAAPLRGVLEADDRMVRFLHTEERTLWLDDLQLPGEDRPWFVLAAPVRVRHEIIAIALYGTHENGTQIDPEEESLITLLAAEAARAYDHVDAMRLRAQLRSTDGRLGQPG